MSEYITKKESIKDAFNSRNLKSQIIKVMKKIAFTALTQKKEKRRKLNPYNVPKIKET